MSDDIMFNDLLHLTDEEIGSTKIRFIMHFSKSDPIYVFMNNPDELNTEWLLSRKKSNSGKDAEHLHKGESVIGLVRLPTTRIFGCSRALSTSAVLLIDRERLTAPTITLAMRARNWPNIANSMGGSSFAITKARGNRGQYDGRKGCWTRSTLSRFFPTPMPAMNFQAMTACM